MSTSWHAEFEPSASLLQQFSVQAEMKVAKLLYLNVGEV